MNGLTENTCTVQLTNDACTLSKRSMIRKKYFNDDYVRHFVKKPANRAPLINRFYAVRAKAIEACASAFVESYGCENAQIVSFGAGFDTTYFRLSGKGCRVAKYIEIDLPDVVERKRGVILSNSCLKALIEDPSIEEIVEGITTLKTKWYNLLGVDLHNLDMLMATFRKSGVDFSAPTLFIDECALTYLDMENANSVLKWVAAHFDLACSFTYTQVEPNDGFGHVMTSHFKKIQSPLLGIESFPKAESHVTRSLDAGFCDVDVVSKYDFYFNYLTQEDRNVFENIEAFDEHEEMHLALRHYCLIFAYSEGLMSSSSFVEFMKKLNMDNMCSVTKTGANQEEVPESPNSDALKPDNVLMKSFLNRKKVGRFGHSCTFVPSENKVFVFGGITSSGAHVAVNSVDVIDLRGKELVPNVPIAGTGPSPRIFHSAVLRGTSDIIVFGGRSGFKNEFNDLYVLDCRDRTWQKV